MIKKTITLLAAALTILSVGAQHFEPVWQNPFNPMNVFIVGATINGIDMMEGSEIGIFDIDPNTGQFICVGSKMLTDEISPDDLFQIICSMDDGTSSGYANGFTPGNPFWVKFYTPTLGETEFCEFEFPYPGYDETFTSLGTSVISAYSVVLCGKTQTLTLPAGWSGVSTSVHFLNTSVDYILQPIINKLEVFSDLSTYFSPLYPQGTLEYWANSSGYFIKLDEPVTFEIQGLCILDNEIQIYEGWNLIPNLSSYPSDIESLFSGNLDKIEIIKEAAGLHVYWPEKQVFTLQALEPGKAYLIKASEDFPLTFSE